VAGVILDQWLRGNRRHLWISKSETLIEDARRDWSALGGLPLDIQHLNQWKLGTPIALGDGILFLTYATLRSNRGDRGTRLRQLIEWMGEDFSGVIVFDEAHEMAGVAGGEGRFGATKGSEQGIAGVRLQNLAPRPDSLRFGDGRLGRQQPRLCDTPRIVGTADGLRRPAGLRGIASPRRHRSDGVDRPRPQGAGPLCRAGAQLRRRRI
jgi:hypothetical protein